MVRFNSPAFHLFKKFTSCLNSSLPAMALH
uniref:Uncharacterized protein n=1 Tax=Rhizophora mucronata TaxID=61149 RepID=A0A2P2JGJ5_RHIMU